MVNEKILPGLKGQKETIVCEHNAAGHVGKFSTPAMIGLMEQASMQAVQHLLDPNQTTVGYEVNIRHMAPADMGARIIAHAELTEIQRNRLSFTVAAYDGDKKIGEGTHRRAIINTDPAR